MAQKFGGRSLVGVAIGGAQPLASGAFSAAGGGDGSINTMIQQPVPLMTTRIFLEDLRIDVAAANDYGSAELLVFPNRDFIIKACKIHGGDGTPFNGSVVLSGFASNSGAALFCGIGTGAAAATPLTGAMVNVLQETQGTSILAGVGNVNAVSTVSLDGLRIAAGSSNKLYMNVRDAVTAGTGSLSFFQCYVDLFFYDLGPK